MLVFSMRKEMFWLVRGLVILGPCVAFIWALLGVREVLERIKTLPAGTKMLAVLCVLWRRFAIVGGMCVLLWVRFSPSIS